MNELHELEKLDGEIHRRKAEMAQLEDQQKILAKEAALLNRRQRARRLKAEISFAPRKGGMVVELKRMTAKAFFAAVLFTSLTASAQIDRPSVAGWTGTAYHEGGHTLVGMMLKHADPVHKVTIIPRGRAGGYTLMLPKEDRSYATRSELMDRLKVAMGGRVAEEVVLKEISTGASQDIQQASRIVRSMIMQYGMSDQLGPIAYGESQNHQVFLGRDFNHQRNYSEEVASEIDKEVRRYMEEAYEACRQIITEHRDQLELIAQALIERETLSAKELEELLEKGYLSDDDHNRPRPNQQPPQGPKEGDPAYIPPTKTVPVEAPVPVAEEKEEEECIAPI